MVIEVKMAVCLALLMPLLAALFPVRGTSFLAAAVTVFLSGFFLLWQAKLEPVSTLDLYTWLAGDTRQWVLSIAVEELRLTLLFLFNSVALLLAIYAVGFRVEVEPRDFSIAALVLLPLQLAALAASEITFLLAWVLLGFAALWSGAEGDGWNGVRPVDRLGDGLLVAGMVLLLVDISHGAVFCLLGAIWTRMGHFPFPLEMFRTDIGRCKGWFFALIGDLASPFLAFVLFLRYRAVFAAQAEVLDWGLYVGLGTGFLAGFAALKVGDVRRSLSMTTAGQMGLVLALMAMGAEASAIFLLAVHGIAKALARLAADGLALAAGGKWDRRELGRLRRQLPLFTAIFSLASLFLALAPALAFLWIWDGQEAWVLGVWSALTFLYALQGAAIVVRVFALPALEQTHAFPAPQQASDAALVGLAALALGVVAALPYSPLNWLSSLRVERAGSLGPLTFVPLGAGALGLLLAWLVFRSTKKDESVLRPSAWGRCLAEGYYLRDLYALGGGKPLLACANWWRTMSAALAELVLMEGIALVLRGVGLLLALVHNGRVRGYGVVMLMGIAVLLWGMAKE